MAPSGDPILTPLIWRNIVSLKLNYTNFVAMPTNSMKTAPGKGREAIDGPRYKKSAHIRNICKKRDDIKRDQKLGLHTNGQSTNNGTECKRVLNTTHRIKFKNRFKDIHQPFSQGMFNDCFSVLHRARNKSHLKFLEAIYISMNRRSLCRQLNNHILNIFGELLDTGVTLFCFLLFPLSGHSAYISHIYTPFLVKFPVFPT